MKKILIVLSLIAVALLGYGQGINFEKSSFDDVLSKARKNNKMVFVDAYAVWCGPCKWMAENVFKEKEVGEYFDENIVAIKIDVERGEGPSVKSRYAVEGLPGYLFLDAEGNILLRGSGSMSKEKFMEMLEKAKEASLDPNNVGRLAARYPMEKENEAFLKKYLDKLKESGAVGYYDVVEQYLRVQKTMKAESGYMVMFLYHHAKSLIFGGEADKVLRENLWNEAWDEYVVKDIRECFQRLPDNMARQTVEYAVMVKDTAFLNISQQRAQETGVPIADGQKERLLLYYYLQTGDGVGYKKLAKPQLDAFYNSLNVSELKMGHQRVLEQIKKNPNRKRISFAEINSDKLRGFIAEYARFADNSEDAKAILHWSQRVYDLLPEAAKSISFYAKALYLYGDKNMGIELMQKAVKVGENEKDAEGLRKDLELMKSNKAVILTV
ncbi:MAG: thioredoxin family protein [Odoribacter sp.]